MPYTKEHPDVISFMVAYRNLSKMCGEIGVDPSELEALAADEEPIKRQCLEVAYAAMWLQIAERDHPQLFSAPVDSSFIQAWRDYEDRYSAPLTGVFLSDLGLNLERGAEAPQIDKFERQREYATALARERANAIESALDFAEEQASQDWRDFPEGFAEQIKAAIAQWRRLGAETGFHLEDVFRRRQLIPFTLIPKHVSDHHGSEEKLSLFTHLQQAHDAFVFGVPFAALALMRSILELVLREHYGSTGEDLKALIDNASSSLPKGAKGALHRLRHLANDILHFERQRVRMPADMERELFSDLYTLRTLIERAPFRHAEPGFHG